MINFAKLATLARLLSEAAESGNLALCDTWAPKIAEMVPGIQTAFIKKIEEELQMTQVLQDYTERREYEAAS